MPSLSKRVWLQVTNKIFISRICCYQGKDGTKSKQRSEEVIVIVSVSVLCVILLAYTVDEILFEECQKQNHNEKSLEILSQAKGEIRMQRFITDERTGIQ